MLPATATAAPAYTQINDLGTGLYLNQFPGGLYPGGSNAPPTGHLAQGVARASLMSPLNPQGQPDPAGKFVFLSVGMSNTTQEWAGGNSTGLQAQPWSFMGQAAAHPAVNHTTLTIFNGAAGGQTAATWDQPTDTNYTRVATNLQNAGLSELQVRAAWVKVANPQPTTSMPAANSDANLLVSQIGNIVRAMKQRYPNLLTVFLSSRIYAGYATTTLNPEPYAYESGFAVKRVIEAQINQTAGGGIDPLAGDLDYGTGVAPWLAWGPYLWADGTNPRSDGLTWTTSDFEADGTHPSQAGEQKVGRLLMREFIASAASQRWFLSTLPGDANVDRSVNIADFALLAANFNLASSWGTGDFNYDQVTNIADFALLAGNFNLTVPADRASAVPEPQLAPAALLAPMTRRIRTCRARGRGLPDRIALRSPGAREERSAP